MGKIAIVFPAGSKYSGMGKELFKCSEAAARSFDMADN